MCDSCQEQLHDNSNENITSVVMCQIQKTIILSDEIVDLEMFPEVRARSARNPRSASKRTALVHIMYVFNMEDSTVYL